VTRLLAATLVLFVTGTAAQEEATSGLGAVLRGLNKVNGQTVDVEILSGARGSVFELSVEVADCRFPVGNPTGDAFAYLTIRDNKGTRTRFQGWMIASSPALNALDHNRFDVWVLRCITS
jgi:hypothetical protein